jgi:Tol biopolymer transport system component
LKPPARSAVPALFATLLLAVALSGCGGTVTRPNTGATGTRLVAFASNRTGSFDIFIYDLDRQIQYGLANLNHAIATDRSPALAADATVLAFVTDRAGGMGGLDLLIYDITGAAIAPTPHINSAGNEDDPAFTGDVLNLLFVRDTLSDRRLRMINGITDRFVLLPGIDAPPGSGDWSPAPSQTGARIAFVSDRNGNPDIFVYDASGDSLLALPGLASDSTDTEPSLTPDARYLAFASTRPGGAGGSDIFLYDLQTKTFVTLVMGVNSAQDERQPSISANGMVLSFESNRSGGVGGFDVWNHDRQSGATGQGANQNSAMADLQPSLRWP